MWVAATLAAVLVAAAATPGVAAMFDADYAPCGDRPNTVAIVECVTAKDRAADQRLNAVYGILLRERADPGQREALRAAQRLWVQFRDANCRFYAAAEGSLAQVAAAECLRAMTADRARELANSGPGEPIR